ncbi:acyltransferase family protein [Terriglobus tenax]|uniref:acyltransferase family protein n=1 Tax=Terriglobus tenax TaxID=1111115 RepID=UPI0021E08C7D|nr:acyltransferase [Terriglobus tenax]
MQLRRITTGSNWLPELDGLRFVAIAIVLLTHVFGHMWAHGFQDKKYLPLFGAMSNNDLAVPLFFVISGFILARPFVRAYQQGGKPVKLGAYYMRRVTRLEPPYILSLLLYLLALIIQHKRDMHLTYLSLLTSVFYVHNFFSFLPAINLVTWSLEVEIQFYIVAPLLWQLFRIQNRVTRRGVIVALIAFLSLLPTEGADHVGFFLGRSISFFVIGGLLADLHIDQRPKMSSHWWDPVCLVLLPTFLLWNSTGFASHTVYYKPMQCLTLFCGFSISMFSPTMRRLLAVRWIAILGGMCYSLYLMHMMVLSFVFPVVARLLKFQSLYANYLLCLAIMLPAIVLVAGTYYVLIERPCMDPEWPRKLMARFRKTEQSVSTV